MARWVAIFEDTDGMLAVRQQREPAHLACLEAHAPGRRFVGGLWVLEVADRAEAVRWSRTIPVTSRSIENIVSWLGVRRWTARSSCDPGFRTCSVPRRS
jgi:hypothetical protein